MTKRILARIFLPEDAQTLSDVLSVYGETYNGTEVVAPQHINGVEYLEIYDTYVEDDDEGDE